MGKKNEGWGRALVADGIKLQRLWLKRMSGMF
jgi:hypothetical protein